MTDYVSGKAVVITGASSGMGAAAARHLATMGATVVLGARRSDRIEGLAAEIADAGGNAKAVVTDVTKREDVRRLVDAAVETYGRIDVLINNAGVMPLSPMARLKVDECEKDVQQANREFAAKVALPAETFARLVAFAISEPEEVGINEILFRPTAQEL